MVSKHTDQWLFDFAMVSLLYAPYNLPVQRFSDVKYNLDYISGYNLIPEPYFCREFVTSFGKPIVFVKSFGTYPFFDDYIDAVDN